MNTSNSALFIDGEPLHPGLATRGTAGLAAGSIIAGSVFVALYDPAKSNLFPVCPLYTLTGFACPGCGLTRGFHSLFHGDIIPAIDFNALIPVWAVIFAWVFVSLTLLAVRGRGLPMWPTWPRFLWTFLIVLVVFGVLRNIPVWPLTILFP
ncbi:MAG: DUF2752 domain-containing protein [Pyrinomonadaceae bacterium]